jgi:hypothetical protein
MIIFQRLENQRQPAVGDFGHFPGFSAVGSLCFQGRDAKFLGICIMEVSEEAGFTEYHHPAVLFDCLHEDFNSWNGYPPHFFHQFSIDIGRNTAGPAIGNSAVLVQGAEIEP